jgi:chaperonin GroES
MNVRPIRDLVVISKEDGDKMSAGGIHLVASVDKAAVGTVLAVGSGYLAENGTIVPLEVKVGERVSFNRQGAQETSVNGETVYLVREDHLLCVLG